MKANDPDLDFKQYFMRLSRGQVSALELAQKLTDEHGEPYVPYQLSKSTDAYRMGYRFICAAKSQRAQFEAEGSKMLVKHKPPVIVLPGDESGQGLA